MDDDRLPSADSDAALGADTIEELAQRLLAAERSVRPGPPLSDAFSLMTIADADAVDLRYIAARTAAGARLRGHKVSYTNPVIQQLLHINQPDYGQILDEMILPGGPPSRCG